MRKHQRTLFGGTVRHLSNERLLELNKRGLPGPTWDGSAARVARAAASSVVRRLSRLTQLPKTRDPARELQMGLYFLATSLWGVC